MSEIRVVVPEAQKATYENWHFAPAAEAGGFVFISGQIGVGADGSVSDDPESQFMLAFQNVETVLKEAGLSWGDVVELSTFHVGLHANIATFSSVKDRFVTKPYPSWTAVGVAELALPGAIVEIKAIARKRA